MGGDGALTAATCHTENAAVVAVSRANQIKWDHCCPDEKKSVLLVEPQLKEEGKQRRCLLKN